MGAKTQTATQHVLEFSIKAPCLPRVLSSWFLPSSPAPMRETIPMPLELILSIIDIASYNERHGIDKRTLQACSLVCKAWAFPAQTLLFRNVRILSGRLCDTFIHTSTPHLRSTVKNLMVSLDQRHPDPLHPDALAELLLLCPNIEHLDLGIYSDNEFSFDARTLATFHRVKLPSLRLANWTPGSALLKQLLHAWPTLQALSLSGNPSTFVADRSLVPCAFRELSLNARPSASVEFLLWLLSSSSESLKIVQFDRTPRSETLSYITETFGPQLSYLALPSCNLRHHVEAIEHCTSLEDFKLEAPANPPFVVWKNLPPTVKRIGLGIHSDTVLQSLLDIIRSSFVLAEVVVHLWDGAERNPQLASLKIACALSGVDLRFTQELSHFRELTKPR
ncbi:hypothetical protein DL96DRAFT_1572630 [Flagelloscypha sp. PMI_526]|nr:hypothetical protein DL96DRAFT_1572630 [Flagelloscypha sp. PMI_526]